MVDSRKTHKQYQTTLYLITSLITRLVARSIACTALLVLLAACSSDTPYKVVDLNFKSSEQVKQVLEHLLEDTTDYQFSGDKMLAPADANNIDTVLSIIQEIDKPPLSYQLTLKPKNIRRYSTSGNPATINLTEGFKSSIRINKKMTDILILKAGSNSSLLDITTYQEDKFQTLNGEVKREKTLDQNHHWIIKHNQQYHLAKDIFTNGFSLTVVK
jgi:hypothetical protein